jgi:hypothetical protein
MTNPQDVLYGAWADMRADALEAAAQIADSFGAKDAAGTIRLLAVTPPSPMPSYWRMPMAVLTLTLKAKTTKTEDDEANRLLAAAISQNIEEVERRLKRPAVKRLIKRGVLRLNANDTVE